MTWISRDPRIYSEPFRIKAKHDVTPPLSLGEDFGAGLEPGDLCRYMALPWQADFNECSQEQIGERYAYWWPAQRPDFVYVERGQQLVQVPWVGTDQDQTAPDYIEFADDIDMVRLWSELGFVYDFGTAESPRFLEVDRKLHRS
jgi:L-lysine epsilon oxidase C-terminal domain